MKKLLLFVVTFLVFSCSDDDSVVVNDDVNNDTVDEIIEDDEIDNIDDDEEEEEEENEDSLLISFMMGSWVNKGAGTVTPDEFTSRDCESYDVTRLIFFEDGVFNFGSHCEENGEFFLGEYSITEGVLMTTNYGIEHIHNFKYVYDMEIINNNLIKLYFTEVNGNQMDGNLYEIYERIE